MRTSLFAFLLFLSACGPSQEQKITMETDHELTAEGFSREHARDRKRTHQKYDGKKLMVRGTVFKTSFTSDRIHGIDGQIVELDGPKSDIKCFLKNDDRADDLKKGMKVKVAGTYLKADLYPMLKDCQVVILEE